VRHRLFPRFPYFDARFKPRIHEGQNEASRAKFLTGHMASADEDGVCQRVMITANRIECVVEVG